VHTDHRLHSPAAERNQGPLLAQLQSLLPAQGVALEIASGTGQHVAHFAAGLPGWRWWPSDKIDEGSSAHLASISVWCAGLANVAPPLALDVMSPEWLGVPAQLNALFCANLLHIAPWPSCAALMQGAARHLAKSRAAAPGLLLIYGPFVVDGQALAPSNAAFDADLRARHPAWGLRRLADVQAQARAAGLQLRTNIQMPANNLLLVFEPVVSEGKGVV
jgi:Protein of unknown function (DUF938)